jgi:FtsP/CotA-like multicopper oxidase with cupredoxin domain
MRAVTRLRFLDFAGKTVAHCHIIGHEVAGMMIVYELLPLA